MPYLYPLGYYPWRKLVTFTFYLKGKRQLPGNHTITQNIIVHIACHLTNWWEPFSCQSSSCWCIVESTTTVKWIDYNDNYSATSWRLLVGTHVIKVDIQHANNTILQDFLQLLMILIRLNHVHHCIDWLIWWLSWLQSCHCFLRIVRNFENVKLHPWAQTHSLNKDVRWQWLLCWSSKLPTRHAIHSFQ